MSERDTLAALICERNDHPDAPACEGCYAMAAWLREHGYVRAAPSPDAPGLREANSQILRVAAQRVLDDWNRIGSQGDGYRALRAALALPPRDALDVERLVVAVANVLPAPWGERAYAERIAREYAAQSEETP